MKVFAFVPAKGTSERVPNKNMRFLDGERLYIRALKILLDCKEIDTIFLDTECEEMFFNIDYLPIKFMHRKIEFANNSVDGHQMFVNEINNYPEADIYVQLLCTSPFIKSETIDKAILKLKNDLSYDSAILMKKDKYYFWNDNNPAYNKNLIPNSKDLPDTISETMGLYICRKEAALKYQRRYGDTPYFIWAELQETIDVNTNEDLIFAEIFAKGLKTTENQKLNLIKHFISSPALSDLLDDMKIEKGENCGAVINNFQCNIKNHKLLGRANTLKLRKLNENEDFRGIYDALSSYEGISENDIIMVENELSEFAYFGDLNARLAIRSGASGVIINGVTRDYNETSQLGLPVFSKGYNATDVRRRATVESINKPIKFGSITITPGDLIFADECAIVIIYKRFENELIKRVLTTFKNEKNIINDILDQKSITDIINERGAF